MEIRRVPVSQLNPAAYNPRKDLRPGDAAYRKLERSLDKFGCVEPIVWNERTGNVVGGHQRLKVLLAAGERELDVSVVHLSGEDEKALNVALNKVSGEWDEEALSQLLRELSESSGIDETLTGFDAGELEKLLAELEEQSGPSADAYVDSFFESGVQAREPAAPSPASSAPQPSPAPPAQEHAPEAPDRVVVYGLTEDRLELLTDYLEENGFAYRLEHSGDV